MIKAISRKAYQHRHLLKPHGAVRSERSHRYDVLPYLLKSDRLRDTSEDYRKRYKQQKHKMIASF